MIAARLARLNASAAVFALVVAASVPALAQQTPPEFQVTPPPPPIPSHPPIARRSQWAGWSPDKERAAASPVLVDLASGKELAPNSTNHYVAPCTYFTPSPDGSLVAAVYYSRPDLTKSCHAIVLWQVAPDRKPRPIANLPVPGVGNGGYENSYHFLTFSSDGRLLATRHPGDETIVWETATGKQRLRLPQSGLAVAFGPADKSVICVSRDGLVQHWDLATGNCSAPSGKEGRTDFIFVENARPWADGRTLWLSDYHYVVVKDAITGVAFRQIETRGCALSTEVPVERAWRREGDFLYDRSTGTKFARLDSGFDRTERTHFPQPVLPTSSSKRPLEARLTSRKDHYTIDLGVKTAEEFAAEINAELSSGKLPSSPKVDLVLTLLNTGTEVVRFDPADIHVSAYLVGDGAMNHPLAEYQTGYIGREKHETTLAPGELYMLPVKSLDFDHCLQSYWLLPGVYTLHASAYVFASPAPKEVNKPPREYGHWHLDVPPLQLKVVTVKGR